MVQTMANNYSDEPDLGEYAEFVGKPTSELKAYLLGQENAKVSGIFFKYVQGMSSC